MAPEARPGRRDALLRRAALLLALLPGAAAAAEQWFEVRIGDSKVGYVHEVRDTSDPSRRRTVTDSEIVVARMNARLELREHEEDVEDAAGHLRVVKSETHASRDATELDVVVRAHDVLITTRAGGRSYERIEPTSAVLLGPEGIRALTAARVRAGANVIRYASFSTDLGHVVDVTRRVVGREPDPAGGPDRVVVEESAAGAPLPARVVLEPDGEVVRESQEGPLGAVTILRATTAAGDGAAAELPSGGEDLYAKTLLRANVRLPDPRSLARLRIRIALRPGATGLPDLEGPGQHVLERDDNHAVLEVARPAAVDDAGAERHAGDALVRPNFILQSDHPAVLALARSLRRPGLGSYAQARVLQDWVAGHMRFDAGLAVVPASEVVRDRGGTCVAYAVLLTSLARALEIPARIVMGYVYADNVWAGHAWSEIRVRGRWIPLDAAVYAPGPADAARIAIVHHAADQGAASGALELERVFGRETIRILGYETDGRWVDVPEDAAPYAIAGDEYVNPWLGLRVRKPADFRFERADAGYPDPTVVALRAPDDSEIRLQQTSPPAPASSLAQGLLERGYGSASPAAPVAGRPTLKAVAANGAAIAFGTTTDWWLLEARGGQAADRLDEIAAQLRLGPGPDMPRVRDR